MQRTAVYAATRNLYHDMTVSAKSLLYNNGADNVVFLTEDDTFPSDLPPCISTRNVSNQDIFPQYGPNYSSRWTYMVMMRAALTKLFPSHSRILSLDCDTLICKPIDFLWTVDISDYYYALVEEKQILGRDKPYFNFGVAVHNLDKLRADKADDVIIRTVNTVPLAYCEQDAVNSVCRRLILELPAKYNALPFNKPPVPEGQEYIRH